MVFSFGYYPSPVISRKALSNLKQQQPYTLWGCLRHLFEDVKHATPPPLLYQLDLIRTLMLKQRSNRGDTSFPKNHGQSCPLLPNSAFRPVFPLLAMRIRDGQAQYLVPNFSFLTGRTWWNCQEESVTPWPKIFCVGQKFDDWYIWLVNAAFLSIDYAVAVDVGGSPR